MYFAHQFVWGLICAGKLVKFLKTSAVPRTPLRAVVGPYKESTRARVVKSTAYRYDYACLIDALQPPPTQRSTCPRASSKCPAGRSFKRDHRAMFMPTRGVQPVMQENWRRAGARKCWQGLLASRSRLALFLLMRVDVPWFASFFALRPASATLRLRVAETLRCAQLHLRPALVPRLPVRLPTSAVAYAARTDGLVGALAIRCVDRPA